MKTPQPVLKAAPKASNLVGCQRVGSIVHLRVAGAIDETFSLQPFAAELIGSVLVDLGQVERISSYGIRRWIEFARGLAPAATGLYVINAPSVFVDQLNMVEGFAGVAQILSVLAPYVCDDCKTECLGVIDLQKQVIPPKAERAPEHSCPVCGKPLRFADLPSEFFDYVSLQRLAPPDAALGRYLKILQAEPDSDSTPILKLVQDEITFFRLGSVLRRDLNVRMLSSGLEGKVVYDLGAVSRVEAEAMPRLLHALAATSKSATVLLWRVPDAVRSAMKKENKPLYGGVVSVLATVACQTCGSRRPVVAPAKALLEELSSSAAAVRPCSICGGAALVSEVPEWVGFLRQEDLLDFPVAPIAALEARAMSQYLLGGTETAARASAASAAVKSPQTNLQILRRLGQGGMAEVYLARQVGIQGFEKYVVVKKVLDNFAESPEFVEMLFAEARANARLNHPNIVQTYEVGMLNGAPYILMEYVRGPDLNKLLTLLRRARTLLPIEHAMRIIAETAAGLHYAHSYVDPAGKPHPMVHRDVSPHNVLVSLDGAIKLSDFGIAKVQGENDHTRPGTIKGKVSYISPEAIAGLPLDGRSDVFALGVMLFEMLTGILPFRRENEVATLSAISFDQPPDPCTLNPAIPPEIARIALRAMEKNVPRRTASARQFQEEVEAEMVRRRFNSSPMAVVKYFQGQFASDLARFSPVAATPLPVFVMSGPSMPADRAEGSADVMVDSGEPIDSADLETSPGFKASSNPNLSVKSEHMLDELQSAFADLPLPSLLPLPDLAGLPSNPGAPLAAVSPASPVPLAQRPQALRAAAVSRPAVPVSDARRAAPAPPRTRWLLLAALGVPLIGGLLATALHFRVGGSGVAVYNLDADHRLFLGGVEVDSANISWSGSAQQIAAVAKAGRLTKFGTASAALGINVQAMVEAPVAPGNRAAPDGTLRVDSTSRGCSVSLSDHVIGDQTPLEVSLEAGVEHLLAVRCPGRRPWVRRILAVPGQRIEIQATPE